MGYGCIGYALRSACYSIVTTAILSEAAAARRVDGKQIGQQQMAASTAQSWQDIVRLKVVNNFLDVD